MCNGSCLRNAHTLRVHAAREPLIPLSRRTSPLRLRTTTMRALRSVDGEGRTRVMSGATARSRLLSCSLETSRHGSSLRVPRRRSSTDIDVAERRSMLDNYRPVAANLGVRSVPIRVAGAWVKSAHRGSEVRPVAPPLLTAASPTNL